jgi:uncharacterized small protein (DUF1192 family)
MAEVGVGFLVILLAGILLVGLFVMVVVLILRTTHRPKIGADFREVAELREDVAILREKVERLRDDVAQLKKGQAGARSTYIKEE